MRNSIKPTSSIINEITPPIALRELDDNLGTQTAYAYMVAASIDPRLNGIAVTLEDTRPHFKPSRLGLGGTHIAISPNIGFYREAINRGIVKTRMSRLVDMLRKSSENITFNYMISFILTHELGHARDFANYINNSDAEIAFRSSRQARRSQLATLPLGMPTSTALNAWKGNINGYRDNLLRQGVTPESFKDAAKRNSIAYGKLPCERVADDFALRVISESITIERTNRS